MSWMRRKITLVLSEKELAEGSCRRKLTFAKFYHIGDIRKSVSRKTHSSYGKKVRIESIVPETRRFMRLFFSVIDEGERIISLKPIVLGG